jgi:hypothetical protein
MSKCRRGCLHRQLVDEYRVARHASELAAEREHKGNATERREAAEKMLTFKQWLLGGKR